MISKIRKMPYNQKGFTLVELMTVLIILGVIMSIGVPKYLVLQAQAEYDADVVTIENMAKAAEVYAAQKNDYDDVYLSDLISKKIVDGSIALNRMNGGDALNTSVRNEDHVKTLLDYTEIKFQFDRESGQVINLEGESGIIVTMIGNPLYQ